MGNWMMLLKVNLQSVNSRTGWFAITFWAVTLFQFNGNVSANWQVQNWLGLLS